MGIGVFFQVGGAGGTPIWVGDMSDDPSHGHIPGEFLAHIFQTDYGQTAKAMGGWELVVPTSIYRYGGGEV